MIEDKLNIFAQPYIQSGTPIPPLLAFNKLNEIVDQVRAAIAAHPTTHINNITIP